MRRQNRSDAKTLRFCQRDSWWHGEPWALLPPWRRRIKRRREILLVVVAVVVAFIISNTTPCMCFMMQQWLNFNLGTWVTGHNLLWLSTFPGKASFCKQSTPEWQGKVSGYKPWIDAAREWTAAALHSCMFSQKFILFLFVFALRVFAPGGTETLEPEED